MANKTNIDTKRVKKRKNYIRLLMEDIELPDTDEEDPLLTMSPIVLTTKLDEMRTINKNLTDIDIKSKELIELLHNESKPILRPHSKIRKLGNSVHLGSYAKLSNTLHSVNFKTKLKIHTTYVRNLKLRNQCKECSIILEDFKKISPKSNTAKSMLIDSQNEPVPSSSLVEVKKEIINHDEDVNEVKVKVEVIDISDSETEAPKTTEPVTKTSRNINKMQDETVESSSSTTIQSRRKISEIASSTKIPKTITPQNKKLHSLSSGKKTKSKENREPSRLVFESSDEEEATIVNIKKKPVPIVINSVAGTQQGLMDKYGLIVLLKTNKEEAFVYRVNALKLVTDYYITSEYDEYKLASIYPKEEKIVEIYCCWHKREEIVAKICSRKNYPFTIQTFLRVPHSCHSGNCQCCCFNNHVGKSKEPKRKRRAIVNKSIDFADTWIRSLLERNQAPVFGLVAKAMSYIPKAQVKEILTPTEPAFCLENVLLWLNYNGSISDAFKNTSELYVIGKNGHPVTTYIFDESSNEEKDKVRQSYASLNIKSMETEFCCWYSREQLLQNLRENVKISQGALKLMQLSHPCQRNNCICCCKPDNVLQLKADIDIIPSKLKHTTTYDKDVHPLTIRFNVKSKNAITNTKSKYSKPVNSANASTAAAILSDCARKQNNEKLSINILSKFKNLKLDLTSGGELEVVLNAPARNLSFEELKVLSDILALSREQMTKLGITAEEFCNRINNRGQTSTSRHGISKVSKTHQTTTDASENIEMITPEITAINTKEIPQDRIASIEKPNLLSVRTVSHSNTKSKVFKTATVTPKNNKQHAGNSGSNVCTSLTNLIEKKSKNYVHSFKAYFGYEEPTVVSMPEISKKFRPVPELRRKPVEETSLLPKIAETFTLAKSNAIAGPSKSAKTQAAAATRSDSNQASDIQTNTAIQTRRNKRKNDPDTTTTNKRLRVKNPSELLPKNTSQAHMITSTPQVPISTKVTNPIPMWPVPIAIKQEPQLNFPQIGIPQQPIAIQINPNLQTGAYIIGNNVVNSHGIQIVNASNNLYKVDGNNIITTTMSNVNPGFVLTPVQTANVNNVTNLNSVDKTMLAQILKTPQIQPFTAASPLQAPNVNNITNLTTVDQSILAQILKHPQVQPFTMTPGNVPVPPLVPFGSSQVQQSAAQSLQNIGMPVLIKKENSDK